MLLSKLPGTFEFLELWRWLDLVVDGGVISHRAGGGEGAGRQGSTVVDLSQSGAFSIIRPGTYYQQTMDLLKDQFNLREDQSSVVLNCAPIMLYIHLHSLTQDHFTMYHDHCTGHHNHDAHPRHASIVCSSWNHG
jgi:hypothetical protein